MGSTIAPLSELYSSTDIVGNSKQQLTFIQFFPGTVTNVVAGNDAEKYERALYQSNHDKRMVW